MCGSSIIALLRLLCHSFLDLSQASFEWKLPQAQKLRRFGFSIHHICIPDDVVWELGLFWIGQVSVVVTWNGYLCWPKLQVDIEDVHSSIDLSKLTWRPSWKKPGEKKRQEKKKNNIDGQGPGRANWYTTL
jgi:hypothetical protein